MADQRREPLDTSADRSSDAAPCLGCGLCCDGTIYTRARAYPDEWERLERAGLRLSHQGERSYFCHPCRFAKDGACGIYEERFKKCRDFRCAVLKAYRASEITREEALGRDSQVLELRKTIAGEEPEAALWTRRRQLRKELERSRQRPALLLKMVTLDYMLDKWFRNKGD